MISMLPHIHHLLGSLIFILEVKSYSRDDWRRSSIADISLSSSIFVLICAGLIVVRWMRLCSPEMEVRRGRRPITEYTSDLGKEIDTFWGYLYAAGRGVCVH
ncbi:hypothetical protein L6452_26357 [Arctium lappa]|uniref:Uncharacterized protein n=1 Tax=Arctium lappa TaxID=4217 RepID=A0ACB9AD11_ARCLA|nr:hypothetical protein L6452_26357 [Arctium lappa]